MAHSEFDAGSTLVLLPGQDERPIEATIVHACTPFTMSPVLRVSLRYPQGVPPSLGADAPSEAILKLYDRRCLANTREEFGDTIEYTSQKQQAYEAYLKLSTLQSEKSKGIDFDDREALADVELSDGEFEGYIAHWTEKFYDTELQTYRHLQSLQGTRIPQLYTTITYPGARGIPDPIPGLLLEYVPSLSLRQFIRHNPPYPTSTIQTVCDDALKTINAVNDLEVLNEDVRLDNLLVRKSAFEEESSKGLSHCVLIDLSHCRPRKSEENDDEWRQAKQSQDEEGAIGYVVQREVKEAYSAISGSTEDVWVYKPSGRYYSLNED